MGDLLSVVCVRLVIVVALVVLVLGSRTLNLLLLSWLKTVFGGRIVPAVAVVFISVLLFVARFTRLPTTPKRLRLTSVKLIG